jgi:predicted amidophosphoribosyltransferase
VVWAIKFGRDKTVAREAALALVALADSFGLFSPGLVVPAPAASRKWQRFDGVNFLAAEIAGFFGCEFKAALLRLPGRAPQVGMDWFQRRQGLEKYVELKGSEGVSGRDVWLVDDVYTTGATGDAAARALLLGGARQVAVVTLAN